jgi:hypothetical protein
MEKKTAFPEIPSEMIDGLDQQNNLGDRSTFISDLLDKQLQRNVDNLGVSTDLTNMMGDTGEFLGSFGELNLINSKGSSLGNFDVNIPDRFEHIAKKIGEISMDHIVRVRPRNWR